MQKFIMSIDQGTTGTTISLYDLKGMLVRSKDQDFPQNFPQPGWVEHKPEDIWQSVLSGITALSRELDLKGVQAIGITNQRETVMVWDRKSGHTLGNAIVWQDRRTQQVTEKLKKRGLEKQIQKRTGLLLDPYFSASKIQWILNQHSGSRKKQLAVGTVDTYLLWRLTAGKSFATDVTNASRTMLMNLQSLQWDASMCKLFQVPEAFLPTIRTSCDQYGHTLGVPGLPDGIPITGIIGDQQAALFGQGAFQSGECKCTFGTGSFILMNTGKKRVHSRNRLLTTVAWQWPGQPAVYALEGGAFVCGAAVQWLRDGMKLFDHSADVEKLAASVSDTDGVVFVPALTGLGAPHWRPEVRGQISGLTRGSTSAHIARATLEAMALQNVDIMQAMQKDSSQKIKRLRVDGGAAANNLLMQMQSDLLAVPVDRPRELETTSKGAMLMAGLGAGIFSAKDLGQLIAIEKEFRPAMSAKVRSAKLKVWESAIASMKKS